MMNRRIQGGFRWVSVDFGGFRVDFGNASSSSGSRVLRIDFLSIWGK